jgi:hypothetical protein
MEKCYDEKADDVNIDALKSLLRQMDKPWIDSIWDAAISQYNTTYAGKNVKRGNRKSLISYVFKNLASLRQFRTLSWEEGIEYNARCKNPRAIEDGVEGGYTKKVVPVKESKPDNSTEKVYSLYNDDDDFEPTEEMLRLFGSGYTAKIYHMMWDKYQVLKESYPDFTTFHTEALANYVRLKVQEELAITKGDVKEATDWGAAARQAADKAKINPSQLKKGDFQSGLNSFSELFMAIEQAVDVIPILPRFKYHPNDAIDFNIFCYVNYIRELQGKPLCSYEEIYNFYDERKKEYIEQYGDACGIFTDDPSEKNREAISKFLTVPDDYNASDSESEAEVVIGEDEENGA